MEQPLTEYTDCRPTDITDLFYVNEEETGYVSDIRPEGPENPLVTTLDLALGGRVRHPDYIHLPNNWKTERVKSWAEEIAGTEDLSVGLIDAACVAELGRQVIQADEHGWVRPPLNDEEKRAIGHVRSAVNVMKHRWIWAPNDEAILVTNPTAMPEGA
jgi:hypothetical protein